MAEYSLVQFSRILDILWSAISIIVLRSQILDKDEDEDGKRHIDDNQTKCTWNFRHKHGPCNPDCLEVKIHGKWKGENMLRQ